VPRRRHAFPQAYVRPSVASAIAKLADLDRPLVLLSRVADGISIPSSYTAYLSPLSSSKLYNEVTSRSSTPAASASTGSTSAAETPYVVMFQAVNTLSGNPDTPSSLAVDGTPILGADSGRCGGQVQACWAFDHPRRDVVLDARGLPLTNSHNTRSAHLSFHIPHAGALHGLA
jgi:protein arginine N-methyltransferase 5